MREAAGKLLQGTCGWASPHQALSIYGGKVRGSEERLRIYSRKAFAALEIDTTTYAIPNPERTRLWAGLTPPGFTFLVKAFGVFCGSVDVGNLEVVGRLFDFVLVVDIAIRDAAERAVGPDDVVDAFDILQVHGQSLEAVGDLARDRFAFQAADLLEIRELRDLHAVQPDFPADSPGAQCRGFPVVLDEPHVMDARVDSNGRE